MSFLESVHDIYFYQKKAERIPKKGEQMCLPCFDIRKYHVRIPKKTHESGQVLLSPLYTTSLLSEKGVVQ